MNATTTNAMTGFLPSDDTFEYGPRVLCWTGYRTLCTMARTDGGTFSHERGRRCISTLRYLQDNGMVTRIKGAPDWEWQITAKGWTTIRAKETAYSNTYEAWHLSRKV